jgi:hypothetical protein
MPRKCKCGGTLKRTDIVGEWSNKYRMVLYHDTDRLVAHFECASCGTKYTQRKRQPASAARVSAQPTGGAQ